MLSPNLNVAALEAKFKARGRVEILDALENKAAEAILEVLAHHTKWMLALNRGAQNLILSEGDIAKLGQNGFNELIQSCYIGARTGFQYVYSCYPIVDAIVAKRDLGHPLHEVVEALNDRSVRHFIERVTGFEGLAKADGQATLYRRNNFLTFHNDLDPKGKRRVAYVLGFTKNWRADWGGRLEFYDERGNVELGLLPRFNALNLFAVPTNHAVTFVPPFVTESRYSVTGWFSVG